MTTCSVEQSNLIWMTRASEGACMCSHRSKWLNGCWPMQQYAIPKGTPIQARQEVGHSLGQYCASPSRLTRQHALSTHCKSAQRSIPFSDPKLSGPRGWIDPTSWQHIFTLLQSSAQWHGVCCMGKTAPQGRSPSSRAAVRPA